MNDKFRQSPEKPDQQQRSSSQPRRPFDYDRNQAQRADHLDQSSSSKPPEDVKNKKRAESTRDTSTATSTELEASKQTQSRGWRHLLKTAFIAALAATGRAQEVHANHTTVVEGIRPVEYMWLNNPVNRSSMGDSHGTMLNLGGASEQRFIRLKDTAKRLDSLRAEQGIASRRIRLELFRIRRARRYSLFRSPWTYVKRRNRSMFGRKRALIELNLPW